MGTSFIQAQQKNIIISDELSKDAEKLKVKQ